MNDWHVSWGEKPEDRKVDTLSDLDAVLDELHHSPVRVMVDVASPTAGALGICLGGGGDTEAHTCLNHVPANLYPPYFSSVGDQNADGLLVFEYGGQYSEIQRRHLIPMSLGREAVRDFFRSGELSKTVQWEQD